MERFCPFDRPLQEGRLIKRYKRFLADVELDGETVTAHCANSGSMMGMKAPGSRVQVLHVPDPKRKLQWNLEMISPDGSTWVGCNTHRPNAIVEWAIREGNVPGLDAVDLRREVKYGKNSRIDILLDDHYVEVKNTTLARPGPGDPERGSGSEPGGPAMDVEAPLEDVAPGIALFPDAVTARGAKHMDELAAVVDAGHQATVVFLVNRGDCDRFQVARHIDPAYGAAFDRARDAGVQMVPLGMDVQPDGWQVRGVLPLL